jgi:hypothetical protein
MYKKIKIPQEYLDILLEKYHSDDWIQTASGKLWLMDKEFVSQFKLFNTDAFVDCSNIFRIGNSYKPHTDVFMPEVKTNVLIPLCSEHVEELKLVIFDQWIKDRGTWVWNTVKDISNYPPKTYQDRPCDHPDIQGLTDQPIDPSLLPHLAYNPEFFYGMSGEVVDWEIGTAIAFPAYHIHTSGKQSGYKVGASIRMSCSFEEAFNDH